MKQAEIYPVTCHTDHVGLGSTFVVVRGFNCNGMRYVPIALEKGASVIVVDQPIEHDIRFLIEKSGAQFQFVPDSRKALAQLSAQASQNAHTKLKIIGITGTKGKTTTAHVLFHMLSSGSKKTALISTTGNRIIDEQFPPSLTTPQPDYLHHFFKKCLEQDVEYVVLEVAAQAISLQRIHGLEFDALIYTNIGREHMEFYDSMDAYISAKKALISYCKPFAHIYINKDDTLLRGIEDSRVRFYSLHSSAFLSATLLDSEPFSLKAHIKNAAFQCDVFYSALSGEYNVSNFLGAFGVAYDCGVSLDDIIKAGRTFPGIPGRQERYVLPNGATAIIDYAHNPISFQAFFKGIRPLTDHIIVVFGAGGDRDQGRRPEMGAIAAKYADTIIITTDNPRSEDPKEIVDHIVGGIPVQKRAQIMIEYDRERAIQSAYSHSKRGSIIALLGKGPDEYQLIQGKKYAFSERAIVKAFQ